MQTPISISLLLLAFCGPLLAAASEREVPAQTLLHAVISNELKCESSDHTHWEYESTSRLSGRERTKETIQSKDGEVELLRSINGHPLALAEQRKEQDRLEKLLHSPARQRKQRQDQAHDAKQAQQLLRVLPEAVTAAYGKREDDLVQLTFKPNPGFHPSSREQQVFHAMEGSIWVDTRSARLVEIDGRLGRSVKFAGGLLGHLDKGGRFQVKQSEVSPGIWEVTLLHVDMRGKALFFKTIEVHQDESRSDFRRVSDNLTLAQAVVELRKQMAGFVSPR